MKKKYGGFRKKRYVGLKRVGKWPELLWEYANQTFPNLRTVHNYWVVNVRPIEIKMQSRALRQKDGSDSNAD